MQLTPISFVAQKTYVHHWPLNTAKWSKSFETDIEQEINKNGRAKPVTVCQDRIIVGDFEFDSLTKIGITIPPFKREFTIIFEARCSGFCIHAHITVTSSDYLDTFNRLVYWRDSARPAEQTK